MQAVGATNLQPRAKSFDGDCEEQRRLRPSLLSQAFLFIGDGEEQGVPSTSAVLSAATESAARGRARALAPAALMPGSGAWPRAASLSWEAGQVGSSTFEAAQIILSSELLKDPMLSREGGPMGSRPSRRRRSSRAEST